MVSTYRCCVTLGFAFLSFLSSLPSPTVSLALSYRLATSFFFFFIIIIINYQYLLSFCVLLMPQMTLFTHPSEVCYGRYDMGYMTSWTMSINRPTQLCNLRYLQSILDTNQLKRGLCRNKCSFSLCICVSTHMHLCSAFIRFRSKRVYRKKEKKRKKTASLLPDFSTNV